jgi:hypothetical protein
MAANSIIVKDLYIKFIILRAKLFHLRIPRLPDRIQIILDDFTLIY